MNSEPHDESNSNHNFPRGIKHNQKKHGNGKAQKEGKQFHQVKKRLDIDVIKNDAVIFDNVHFQLLLLLKSLYSTIKGNLLNRCYFQSFLELCSDIFFNSRAALI